MKNYNQQLYEPSLLQHKFLSIFYCNHLRLLIYNFFNDTQQKYYPIPIYFSVSCYSLAVEGKKMKSNEERKPVIMLKLNSEAQYYMLRQVSNEMFKVLREDITASHKRLLHLICAADTCKNEAYETSLLVDYKLPPCLAYENTAARA